MEIVKVIDTIFKQVRIFGEQSDPLFLVNDIERILETEILDELKIKHILVNGELKPRRLMTETQLRKVINESDSVNAEKIRWVLEH